MFMADNRVLIVCHLPEEGSKRVVKIGLIYGVGEDSDQYNIPLFQKNFP